jgi:hypothetical protein
MKNFKKNTIYLLILVFLASCGGFKKVDSRNIPVNAQERARKNVEEGRGISIKGLTGGNRNTNYEFSTSNPMWRSSLEVLDFLPLTTVDYSGGIIITDWYNDTSNSNDSIKITVRFLSNVVAANSLNIIIHKKNCNVNANCLVNKIDSKIEEELKKTIIRKAALLEAESKKKK